jgi:hypothetical protein
MAEKNRKRYKPKNYSPEMYGARLPFEDARILDDYAAARRQTRADVVRLALHHFALKQQMRLSAKNGAPPHMEQALTEQLRPLQTRLDELAGQLRELVQTTPRTRPATAGIPSASDPVAALAQLMNAQQQLLEQLLVTAMLTLRLQVNYTVAPVLDALPQHDDGAALTPHLASADNGREQWSAVTLAVYRRTGKRILAEIEAATSGAAQSPTK